MQDSSSYQSCARNFIQSDTRSVWCSQFGNTPASWAAGSTPPTPMRKFSESNAAGFCMVELVGIEHSTSTMTWIHVAP